MMGGGASEETEGCWALLVPLRCTLDVGADDADQPALHLLFRFCHDVFQLHIFRVHVATFADEDVQRRLHVLVQRTILGTRVLYRGLGLSAKVCPMAVLLQ